MRLRRFRGSALARLDTSTTVAPEYAEAFARVQEELHAGNSYEVNLTHRLETLSDLTPAAAYLRLRELNPAPYAGFLQHDVDGARAWLLSSSPERYALVTADRTLETKPIKGTTPRGADAAEDEEHRRHLAADPKYRAENLMIVDLLRNDLSMVCKPGTVEVPTLMEVESYETVHQLVSTVRGRLRDHVTTVEALRALFPAGSMTGAPKLRTMQIIDDVESTPRGIYAGAFGWVSGDGRADLGVVIRSLMTAGDGRYLLGTGGGITVLSDVEEEYAEAAVKAERLLRVFDATGEVRSPSPAHGTGRGTVGTREGEPTMTKTAAPPPGADDVGTASAERDPANYSKNGEAEDIRLRRGDGAPAGAAGVAPVLDPERRTEGTGDLRGPRLGR